MTNQGSSSLRGRTSDTSPDADSSSGLLNRNSQLSSVHQNFPDLRPYISGDIVRNLRFYTPPRYQSPPRVIIAHPNGTGIKNYGTVPHAVTVRDIRDKEHRFHLPLHSFKPIAKLAPLPYPVDLKDPLVVSYIHATTIDILNRHLPSPGQITIIDTAVLKVNNIPGSPISPCLNVLYTPSSALLRAKRHLSPVEFSEIESGRLSLRMFALYRPLLPLSGRPSSPLPATFTPTLSDHPLVLTESFSIPDHCLVPVDHVYPDHIGQAYAVKYSEETKYWYWSGMEATEGVLVQIYDNYGAVDGEGRERGVRGATAFCKLMPDGIDEGREAEWLVVKALVVG
ncbi:hypothetical protein ABW19_dt0201301 [Dactylella cylindrospora]|nr:hypothetical protein ABW19_dt0201301 [Dactylella cylindrospora]